MATRNRNLNPANAITASRFLTLPPFFYFYFGGAYQLATLTVLVCAVMDLFDGFVARKLNCQTTFGEIFDAIADTTCYGTFLLTLVIDGRVPRLPAVLIMAMAGATMLMRTLYAKRVGRATNYQSFAMERMVGFAACLVGYGLTDFEVVFYYWSFVVLNVVVIVHDTKRMLLDPIPVENAPTADVTRAVSS